MCNTSQHLWDFLSLPGVWTSVPLRSHIWMTPGLVRQRTNRLVPWLGVEADTVSALTLPQAVGCQCGPDWVCNTQQVFGWMWSLWQWDVPGRGWNPSCLKSERKKLSVTIQTCQIKVFLSETGGCFLSHPAPGVSRWRCVSVPAGFACIRARLSPPASCSNRRRDNRLLLSHLRPL